METRRKASIPERYASRHTGVVQDYALEGHALTREIKHLLQERPKTIGLTIPSMPLGTPGMGGPAYGNRRMPYNVLPIGLDEQVIVFHAYNWWGVTVFLAPAIVLPVRIFWRWLQSA